jgi:hypothetical protein
VTRPKCELISQKGAPCSTSLPIASPAPAFRRKIDAKYPLTSQNSPPYTSAPRKQCLINPHAFYALHILSFDNSFIKIFIHPLKQCRQFDNVPAIFWVDLPTDLLKVRRNDNYKGGME